MKPELMRYMAASTTRAVRKLEDLGEILGINLSSPELDPYLKAIERIAAHLESAVLQDLHTKMPALKDEIV